MSLFETAITAMLAVSTDEFPETEAVQRPLANYLTEERAAVALRAAHDVLLPGLFVALDGGDCLTIWARGDDLAHPASQMVRTADNARLFDAIAALLPREE